MNSDVGIQFETPGSFTGGSLAILDSVMLSVVKGVYVNQNTDAVAITINNLQCIKVPVVIWSRPSGTILGGGDSLHLDTWIHGSTYEPPDYKQTYLKEGTTSYLSIGEMPGLFDSSKRLFRREKPQYQELAEDGILPAPGSAESPLGTF